MSDNRSALQCTVIMAAMVQHLLWSPGSAPCGMEWNNTNFYKEGIYFLYDHKWEATAYILQLWLNTQGLADILFWAIWAKQTSKYFMTWHLNSCHHGHFAHSSATYLKNHALVQCNLKQVVSIGSSINTEHDPRASSVWRNMLYMEQRLKITQC